LIIYDELSLLPFIWRSLFWPSRCRPKIVRSLMSSGRLYKQVFDLTRSVKKCNNTIPGAALKPSELQRPVVELLHLLFPSVSTTYSEKCWLSAISSTIYFFWWKWTRKRVMTALSVSTLVWAFITYSSEEDNRTTGCIKKQIWNCSQFCITDIIIQFLISIASLGTYNVE
jgi:hypothetical protein